MPHLQSDAYPVDEVLGRMIERGEAVGDDGAVVAIAEYAVPGPGCDLLTEAAAAVAPEVSIEIGLGSGLATLAIARGRLRHGPPAGRSLHAIDPHQAHFARIGLHAVERSGLADAFVYHPHPSHVALPRMVQEGLRAQFAFVDGMHQLDYVLVDLFYLDRILDVGGIVAVHDMWMPGLQHAVSYWLANRAYEAVTVRDGAIVARPCASDHRGCGDPTTRPPWFSRYVEPFVHWHTLLMRKTGEDAREWDAFEPYVGGADS